MGLSEIFCKGKHIFHTKEAKKNIFSKCCSVLEKPISLQKFSKLINIMAYKILDSCVACGTCIDECPVGAISEGSIYSINADNCVSCGTCASVCPNEAIVED